MTELENLEQKVAQLVIMHKQIKEENRDLRAQAALLEAENKRLDGKLSSARERVDALLAQIPDTPDET